MLRLEVRDLVDDVAAIDDVVTLHDAELVVIEEEELHFALLELLDCGSLPFSNAYRAARLYQHARAIRARRHPGVLGGVGSGLRFAGEQGHGAGVGGLFAGAAKLAETHAVSPAGGAITQ